MPEVTSLGTETYLFTDDPKAFRGIFQHSDCQELQTDIHALQEWSEQCLLWLIFHPEKCKAMGMGKSRIDKKDYTLEDGIPPMEYVGIWERYWDSNRQYTNFWPSYFRKKSTRQIR